MLPASKIASRLTTLVALALALVVFASDVAVAQSASCQQLIATLDTLNRNRDYRSSDDNAGAVRDLKRSLQRSESSYVRNGCNDDAKAGRRLNAECRSLAREITSGREELASLSSSLDTGTAVAQQREAVLQEIARFRCGRDGSSAGFNQDEQRPARSGNLFDQLFGALGDTFDGDGGLRGGEFDPFGNYHTVRTLCVRKIDGFYWPISYSTLVEYVENDATQCHSQCPGLDVDLYYYDNPGQEPEQMVNTFGEPYTALPTAFKFRTDFDKTATCNATVNYGSISLTATADGLNRAMITYGDLTFPLPIRDPRRTAQVTTVALDTTQFVSVPLPRRRPAAPGETPKAVPVAPVASSEPQRVVQFGDKRVRVVGPATPYAPTAAAGT